MGHTKTAIGQNAPSLVGLLVRSHRLHADLSIRELSALTGLNPSTITKIERGYFKPLDNTIMTIAHALKLGKMARAALIEAANDTEL